MCSNIASTPPTFTRKNTENDCKAKEIIVQWQYYTTPTTPIITKHAINFKTLAVKLGKGGLAFGGWILLVVTKSLWSSEWIIYCAVLNFVCLFLLEQMVQLGHGIELVDWKSLSLPTCKDNIYDNIVAEAEGADLVELSWFTPKYSEWIWLL